MERFLMLNTMNTVVRHMLYVFVLFFKMVQRLEEHRAAIITLYRIGKKSGELFKTLQGLGISHMLVYQALGWYKETGSTKYRPRSSHPRDIRTQKRIHAVCEHIRRNPLSKQKVISRDMKIYPRNESYSQRWFTFGCLQTRNR